MIQARCEIHGLIQAGCLKCGQLQTDRLTDALVLFTVFYKLQTRCLSCKKKLKVDKDAMNDIKKLISGMVLDDSKKIAKELVNTILKDYEKETRK